MTDRTTNVLSKAKIRSRVSEGPRSQDGLTVSCKVILTLSHSISPEDGGSVPQKNLYPTTSLCGVTSHKTMT